METLTEVLKTAILQFEQEWPITDYPSNSRGRIVIRAVPEIKLVEVDKTTFDLYAGKVKIGEITMQITMQEDTNLDIELTVGEHTGKAPTWALGDDDDPKTIIETLLGYAFMNILQQAKPNFVTFFNP